MAKMWRCPDGGTCHHSCVTACFRVLTCEPLSGEFRNNEWPDDVRRMHAEAASLHNDDPDEPDKSASDWQP